MVRKSAFGVFLIFLVISGGFAADNEDVKENDATENDEKTVSKRGIFHLGIHGHSVAPHVHVPIVHKIPVIAKVPTFIKPIVPAVLPAPTIPYHLSHGDAVTTSFNVNYPRVPIFTKSYVPSALPVLPHHHHSIYPHHHHHQSIFPNNHHHHSIFPNNYHHHSIYPNNHHHHSIFPQHHHHNPFVPFYHDHHHINPVYPHVHAAKPIVPVAVPIPGIRHPKFPVYFPQKPIFPHKHDFIPVASPHPTFIPIPVPTNPEANPTVIQVNPGITSSISHNQNHINLFPTTQQTPIQLLENNHHQGNWQPIIMQTKPTQPTVTENCLPYNYHAALKNPSSSSPSNNFPSTNDFVSGQGSSMAQQLALYQQQHILNEQHNSFPYPAAAETFSQNYDTPSNDGNYHGLSSYQVPLGIH